MTVAVAWLQQTNKGNEYLFLSADSRLRQGGAFDCGPKILFPTRGDCALCFAGDTYFAYPMMLQLYFAIEAHRPARTRALDLQQLRRHMGQVFTAMLEQLSDAPQGYDQPNDTEFLFVGYSWRQSAFEIHRASYNLITKRFEWHNAETYGARTGAIAFIGDQKDTLRSKLTELLKQRDTNTNNLVSGSVPYWYMEPFEALRDLLRSVNADSTIGGPPQIVRVYPHSNVAHIPVYWPTRNTNKIALAGRFLLGYENVDAKVLDPDSLKYYWPRKDIQESAQVQDLSDPELEESGEVRDASNQDERDPAVNLPEGIEAGT